MPLLGHLDLSCMSTNSRFDPERHLCAAVGLQNAEIAPLTTLTALHTLDLTANYLSSSWLRGSAGTRTIARITSLTALLLSDNKALGCAGVAPLTALTALRRLALSGTGCGVTGMHTVAQLTRLTHLDVGHNAVSSITGVAMLRALVPLTALRVLHTRCNELDIEGATLALPSVTSLDLLATA
jgi:Leucine-rich repeat (LRR) protein